MRQAGVHNKDTAAEPIVKRLGISLQMLLIHERDCFKIKPKGWMEKKEWREIHDILRVQEFNWLANGKHSCWIKVRQ